LLGGDRWVTRREESCTQHSRLQCNTGVSPLPPPPFTYGEVVRREANPSYQRRPSSLNRGKEMCTFPTNLHRVGRYKRACNRQTTRRLSLTVSTSKKDVNKKCHYRTSSKLENSVLEINHVTNVTTVLSETTVSDRVSRSGTAGGNSSSRLN